MRLRFLSWLALGVVFPALAQAETETLQQAWAMVYQGNPTLLAARAELRGVDEGVSQALSHWRPTVDAITSIGKTYQKIPDEAVYGTANYAGTTRGYGVQFTQPLYRGGRTTAETKGADRQIDSARAKLHDIEQQEFLDTAKAYLDILRDQTVLDVSRHNEEMLREKLKETSVRSRAGELTTTDTHQAESRLARAQVARLQAENSLAQGRAAYMRLVGKAAEKLIAPDFRAAQESIKQIGTVDDLTLRAATQNPNVVAARYAIDEAEAKVDMSKGSLRPELDLVGNTGRNWEQSSSIPGREDSSQIMLQLSIPLYHQGTDYSRTREAEQTVSQRRMNLEEARTKAGESAINAWEQYNSAQAAVVADDAEIDAANRALKGVREESKAGTRTTIDVLNAEQEVLDAQVDRARSLHDRDYALLQLKAALGELTVEGMQVPVKSYDPQKHYNDVRGQWVGFSADDKRYNVQTDDTKAVAQPVDVKELP